jgi:hypothetical protein
MKSYLHAGVQVNVRGRSVKYLAITNITLEIWKISATSLSRGGGASKLDSLRIGICLWK